MRILTVEEARAFDRWARLDLGIPSLVLMENAALAVADALAERWPAARRVTLLCGPGNNGADGLAVARQLATRSYDVRPILLRFGHPLSDDAAVQRLVLDRLGIEVEEWSDADVAERGGGLDGEVTVDALFGVGLTRPLEGAAAQLVRRLGELHDVLAIDLPSGLDGDCQGPVGPAVRAVLTVTFVAPKPALVLAPACDFAGEVVVADLGVPFAPGGGPGALHLLVGAELASALAPRPADAHKGGFGHVLLVAGSAGMTGAMVLAARAAVVAGAGLTTVALPRSLSPELAAGCPEAMSVLLSENTEGGLTDEAGDELLAAAAARSVVAVGPGLGRHPATEAAVRRLALATDRPLVLDADGLNPFALRLEELAGRSGPTVLTPHPGELARLLGREIAEIQADRLAAAREAARRARAVVALKGRGTVIAEPDGEAWVNTTGNAGMASGGSGDVLTGIVAARLAQQETPEFATCLSVHLHGLAGDLAAERLGGPAVPASELLQSLDDAFARLGEG